MGKREFLYDKKKKSQRYDGRILIKANDGIKIRKKRLFAERSGGIISIRCVMRLWMGGCALCIGGKRTGDGKLSGFGEGSK